MVQATEAVPLLAPLQCDRPRGGAAARPGLVARAARAAERKANAMSRKADGRPLRRALSVPVGPSGPDAAARTDWEH
jgi:hypothetical protein